MNDLENLVRAALVADANNAPSADGLADAVRARVELEPRRRPRQWVYPALAAAAVIAAVIAARAITADPRADREPADGSRTEVVCQMPAGTSQKDRDDVLRRIDERLTHYASAGRQVVGDRIQIAATGVPRAELALVCESTSFSIRPVVARPQGNCTEPLSGDDPGKPVELCPVAGLGGALLTLDRPIVAGGGGVESARLIEIPAPEPRGEMRRSMQILLDEAAARAVAAYTAAHGDAAGRAMPSVRDCGSATLPCANFLAVVVGGDVIGIAHTTSVINARTLSVPTALGPDQAQSVVDRMVAGMLPVPLKVLP